MAMAAKLAPVMREVEVPVWRIIRILFMDMRHEKT